jgi:hypothetical protein
MSEKERRGIRPGDVRWLVLTPPPHRSRGRAAPLPSIEILAKRAVLEFAPGLRSRLRGYVANKHWAALAQRKVPRASGLAVLQPPDLENRSSKRACP